MMVPDYTIIAEIILYSEGFEEAKVRVLELGLLLKLHIRNGQVQHLWHRIMTPRPGLCVDLPHKMPIFFAHYCDHY